MPWINLTLRKGTFTKEVQHTVMAKLTDAPGFMLSTKIPITTAALRITRTLSIPSKCGYPPDDSTRSPSST